MDARNRFHTPLTFWIIRGEHIAVILLCSALAVLHAGEMNWWRAFFAFWIIDIVGYLPGAIAFRKSNGGKINRWYHHIYNIAHTYLVTGTGVGLWALAIGRFEWAMLAVPFHLSIDRGVFGNILKPTELSFEPQDHSAQVVLDAVGWKEPSAEDSTEVEIEPDRPRVPEEVLNNVLAHPSGFLALSKRNEIFAADGVPGFIAYREQGKHFWLFGGVHAREENAEALLARFLEFARQRRRRVAAVQVRQSQVELFRRHGFTVNQMGTTYAVSLKDFTFGGGKKMQLRNKIKKARKQGLKVVELGRDVPRDEVWLAKLDAISREWLDEKGKKELDFMIGELDGSDERRRIFTVVDEQENAVAFITYVPVLGDERPGYLHDLTRRISECPTGAMELCNAKALERFQSEGVEYLHFGFTPFIVDPEADKPANRWIHRAIHWLRTHGKKLYPADSQAAYKMKWGTDVMEREYIATRSLGPRTVWDLLSLTRSI